MSGVTGGFLARVSLLRGHPSSSHAVNRRRYDRVCAACKATGVHMGVSTGCPVTVAEVMKRVDRKGWVHIGADLALLVGAVDALFDTVRERLSTVARL
eukprot:COSAG01_NODE_19537_length_1004_cov_1.844199_2_plen_98_part_00